MQIKTLNGMIEIHEYLMACMYMCRLQAIISFLWDYSKPFEHLGQYGIVGGLKGWQFQIYGFKISTFHIG